jgi:hypothetical protein
MIINSDVFLIPQNKPRLFGGLNYENFEFASNRGRAETGFSYDGKAFLQSQGL